MMFYARALGDITSMDSGLSIDPIVSNAAAEIAATSTTPVTTVTPTPAPSTSDTMPLLLLAIAGIAGYYWYTKKHKGGVKLPTFDLMGVQL